VPWLTPTDLGGGLSLFVPDVPDFELLRVDLTDEPAGQESSFRLPGPGIAIVTDGSVRIDGATSSIELGRGAYAFITPDEAELRFSGTGTLFLATTQG
jgi:mannose-6-phosphate isomerase